MILKLESGWKSMFSIAHLDNVPKLTIVSEGFPISSSSIITFISFSCISKYLRLRSGASSCLLFLFDNNRKSPVDGREWIHEQYLRHSISKWLVQTIQELNHIILLVEQSCTSHSLIGTLNKTYELRHRLVVIKLFP